MGSTMSPQLIWLRTPEDATEHSPQEHAQYACPVTKESPKSQIQQDLELAEQLATREATDRETREIQIQEDLKLAKQMEHERVKLQREELSQILNDERLARKCQAELNASKRPEDATVCINSSAANEKLDGCITLSPVIQTHQVA